MPQAPASAEAPRLAHGILHMPRAIRLLLAVNALGYSAHRGAKMALALFAASLGAHAWNISLIATLTALLPMLLASATGRLSDRLGVAPLLLLGTAGMALALVLTWQQPALATLFVTAAMLGAGYIAFQVSMQSGIGLASESSTRTLHFSAHSLTVSLAAVIGPSLGGLLIDHTGYALTFGALGGLALCGTLLIAGGWRLLPATRRTTAIATAQKARSLLSIAPLRRVIITNGAVMGAYDLFIFYLPLHARQAALTASEAGMALGAFGLASIVARVGLPAMVARVGSQRLLGQCMIVASAAFATLPLCHDLITITAAAALIGLALGCGPVLLIQLTYARAPEGRAGEALGYRLAAANAAIAGLPLLFGALASGLGLATIFVANALLLFMGVLYLRKNCESTDAGVPWTASSR